MLTIPVLPLGVPRYTPSKLQLYNEHKTADCSAAVLQCTWCQDWWPLVQLMRAISGKLGCSVLVTNHPDRGTTKYNIGVLIYEKVAVGSKNQS